MLHLPNTLNKRTFATQINWLVKSPIYRQLTEKLCDLIPQGEYSDDDSIPSVCQITVEHQINLLNVSKAFQVLVHEQLIIKKEVSACILRAAHDSN